MNYTHRDDSIVNSFIALSFLHYIKSSKAAENIIRMSEDCSFEDTEGKSIIPIMEKSLTMKS